jgi:carbon monoxide dehydrogenase subunit G
MKCSYAVTVAAPIELVWASLTDVDAVLAALPDVLLAPADDAVVGSIKCKFDGTQITYRVSIRADVVEAGTRSAVIVVTGKEARGAGTLAASLSLTTAADGDLTRVEIVGDVEASGRGESADAAAWSRQLAGLVDAALPFDAVEARAESESEAPRADSPRAPERAVYAPPPATTSPDRRMILAIAGIVLLMLVRWRRKRRQ